MPKLRLSLPHFRPAGFGGEQMGEHGGGNMPRSNRSNPKTMNRAGKLRKESTPAERKLWSRIRNDQLGVTFRRQHAVGNYIPDFCSPKAKLIIELDGSQHLEQEEYDEERTKYLESLGYKVIRFWNSDVTNNIDGIILAIMHVLEEKV
jgi:elongation factor P--(R)-beta-lysine ligase